MKTIAIDADGPLLDGREKHFACYQFIAERLGFEPLDGKTYWQLKRERTPLEKLLALTNAEINPTDFKRLWQDHIESPEFLDLDKLQDEALAKFKAWHGAGFCLTVSSLRQSFDKLTDQLESFGILSTIKKVIVTSAERGGRGKAEAFLEQLPKNSSNELLWIGDTEVDIESARFIGCPIWALSCGLRSADFLSRFKPDFLSKNIGEVEPEKVWNPQ